LRRILGGEERLLDPSALMRGLQRVRVGGPERDLHTRSRLHALWRILAPPRLWRELETAKEVVLVPDGTLNRVAFETLVTNPNGRDVRYWLDEGPAIRYAPSLTALDAISARGSSGKGSERFVIVADPLFTPGSAGEGLPTLPATRLEAAGIRDAFSGLRPVVDLEGSDATEARVRQALAEGAHYVHFATHGLVEERTGDTLATLALSPPQGSPSGTADDGRLQLFEIYDLGLKAELAVLSACDSQVGKVVEGEGVFALSRGFLAGGAQRVIASLWPVEDSSTAELMRDFYGRLARSEREGRPVSYAVVLRDAKRRLRNEERWSAPFFWAPLILTGAR
jgi:CHAT domain-containing protein